MNIGFIGLGRMGQGMAHLLLKAEYRLSVFDAFPEQAKSLGEAGARVADSVADVCADSDVIVTMLPSDAIMDNVATSARGLVASMRPGAVHTVMGTHGVALIQKLSQLHALSNQELVAAHVLGRPDLAATGQLTIVPGGDPEIISNLQPVFDVLGKQTFVAGNEPQAATAVKIANNFVLGCAIEAMGESMSLVRKLGVEPELFLKVLTEGLFGAPAYKVYGQMISDQAYDSIGATAVIGLKDMNLALQAAETAEMPLPSANVMRDRLLGAIAHGEADLDWAVVAREQARASGLDS